MSRGGSSGGGRSSLGYLFEPEKTTPNYSTRSVQDAEKSPERNNAPGDKVTTDEADQEQHAAPLKKDNSNPIVSHGSASNIYYTSQLSKNSGLFITDRPSTRVRCAPGGASSLGFLFGDDHD
ncbi:hypothetical protein GUJ93_ZPchr0060g7197 [Zizania palustris]|uniref:Protein SPIRAL1-like 5 n=1 Tax=Zizania palustris TaxID=103762 RepID=A0A8J5V355_ZIZPA|nr:hypothetical protein GUJ93_ZPchr0060g7197 [Zizania palustris]